MWIEPTSTGVKIKVKAVPGASRESIAGLLGDRLKVRITAPPQDGEANQSLRRLLADRLRTRPAAVRIVAGHASPEKVVGVEGVTVEEAKMSILSAKYSRPRDAT